MQFYFYYLILLHAADAKKRKNRKIEKSRGIRVAEIFLSKQNCSPPSKLTFA